MLELRDVVKRYSRGGKTIVAADGVSFAVRPGDFLIVHGPSGSGKSTLLMMLGGMLPPDGGEVLFANEDIYGWSPARRNAYRRSTVGFVFQRFFLVPYLSVRDNIRLQFMLRGKRGGFDDVTGELVDRLGIGARLDHRPAELSVGEQQRVALARALAGGPAVVLADEPTGNLDEPNARIITECLREEARRGRSVVVVTHDRAFLEEKGDRLELREGQVVREERGNGDPAGSGT